LKNRGKREGERHREKESLDERESGSSAVQQPDIQGGGGGGPSTQTDKFYKAP